ncbi:Bet v1-like protein [Basidiobolus meristosporus CBS 931.73]|uniref:Bet v1-like protein n=1 Tax=Basidiobolus meristosporus CBS 931.73 TaxID=1314790 RepID=A0A1Y1X9F0_9FUNG|nr:Bet v1-like protein [Basidiobolus meristosporus CBS 931.73]|eukprot:ORX82036.1 Bet v1-like protein [Basidiobolus meristosporus CBS 931.73]
MPAATKNLTGSPATPTSNREHEAGSSHQYSEECEKMLSQFVKSLDSSMESDRFQKVLHRTEEPYIQIFQDPKVSYGYKVIARLDCKPELAFEYMLDVERWKEYDDLCDCAEIIDEVDPVTRFQYIRTKPIWPISARDVLLFSTMKKLEDGKYILVGKSMDHKKCPVKKGVLRMDVSFLGMCVFAEPEDDSKCRVVFVADGDPKGWVPKNIVKFVATNAMPLSLRNLSTSLGAMPPIEYKLVSNLNRLTDHKPSPRSPLLSSLRSSILNLSAKSKGNNKSRISIISSFLLHSKNQKSRSSSGFIRSTSVSTGSTLVMASEKVADSKQAKSTDPNGFGNESSTAIQTSESDSILMQSKQASDKLRGKLRRMRTRGSREKEINEKAHTPAIAPRPDNGSSRWKTRCFPQFSFT